MPFCFSVTFVARIDLTKKDENALKAAEGAATPPRLDLVAVTLLAFRLRRPLRGGPNSLPFVRIAQAKRLLFARVAFALLLYYL